MVVVLLIAIFSIPLLTFLVAPFIGSDRSNRAGSFSSIMMLVVFAGSVLLFLNGVEEKIEISWLTLISDGFGIDEMFGLSFTGHMSLIFVVVSLISLLVHVFSIEYMRDDPAQGRYFSFLGLFTFSMFGILLSTSLLQLFVFWELVGVSSYLLIGFWYEKPAASAAGKKAFIVNRVADSVLLLGIILLWLSNGSLDIEMVNKASESMNMMYTSGFLIFIGAMGKSAMFPFHVWLPDAMEGPTPVSALLHAATMVTAGVILVARVFPVFAWDVQVMMVAVGSLTALIGGYAALMQYDIKRILAYSTISQLGYMMAGLGVGAYGASLFHLVTHAFFKAGLFLSAGALIHYLHRYGETGKDVQDIRNLGGLRKDMPVVFYSMVTCSAALAGLPLFSGFLSKDAIIDAVAVWSGDVVLLPMLSLFAVVLITALYMGRLLIYTFAGNIRMQLSERITRPNWAIILPLIVLAGGSVWLVFGANPVNYQGAWLFQFLSAGAEEGTHASWVPAISAFMALVGFGFAWYRVKPDVSFPVKPGFWQGLGLRNYYLDDLYRVTLVNGVMTLARTVNWIDRYVLDGFIHFVSRSYVILAHMTSFVDRHLVDGLVNGIGMASKSMGKMLVGIQSGRIQSYILAALFSILILIWLLL